MEYRRRWAATLLVAIPIAALLMVAPGARVRRAAAHGAPGRVSEPLILTGDRVAALAGATRSQLWLWAFDHDEWELLPLQMDERDDAGDIVAVEDGLLDANDILVFMADALGEATDANPPSMGGFADRVALRVTDPLDADYEAFVYLYRADAGPEIALAPLVTYDPETGVIASDAYRLGLARPSRDGFFGLKSLALFESSDDLLDRLKVRVTASILGSEQTFTEETLPGATDPEAVKSGPVRIVFNAAGTSAAYAARFVVDLGLADLPAVPVTAASVSLDFDPGVGPATYRDANVPDGVPIDGAPDAVPATPLVTWREAAFIPGRLVVLSETAAGAENVYRDGPGGPGDTGDGLSRGETGVTASSLAALAAVDFPGDMVMLSAGRAVTAEEIRRAKDAPLQLSVVGAGGSPTATEVGESPTPTGTTPVTEPTPTGTVPGTLPTPTSTRPGTPPAPTSTQPDSPTNHRLYLPMLTL